MRKYYLNIIFALCNVVLIYYTLVFLTFGLTQEMLFWYSFNAVVISSVATVQTIFPKVKSVKILIIQLVAQLIFIYVFLVVTGQLFKLAKGILY